MTKEEWYTQQSKEQLIIFLKNDDYEMERLRDKIALLTGCRGFGDCDGTNGGCIDCCYDNPNTHDRCYLFQLAFHEYRKKKWEKEKMWTDGITEVIDSIKKELKQSSTTEYICNDGTVIHTDVGYVEDWFNKYEQVLRRRMENKHAGT